ncbi:unnamed protein product [Moneuplotes crassus]|uniref:Uncharacterized protein n=1 Tax=Euplotes crassus TaxID=5936 RepID=A0AAD1XDN6_EUPCR|nr:unnamed protein product [Moneuplotes crassus]
MNKVISDLQAKVNIRRSLKDNPSRSRNEFGIKFNKTTIKNSLNLDKSIPFCEKLAILKSYDKLSKENKTFLPELANDLKTKIKQSRGAILKQKVRYKNGLKIIKLRKTRHSQAYFTDKALSKILIKKGKQMSKASPLGRKSAVAIPQPLSSSSITRVPTNSKLHKSMNTWVVPRNS